MKRNNKLFIIFIGFILLFYTINDDFKLLINTNYNKYSNILETNINYLHNKLIDSSSIITKSTNNKINNNFNSYLVLLITNLSIPYLCYRLKSKIIKTKNKRTYCWISIWVLNTALYNLVLTFCVNMF